MDLRGEGLPRRTAVVNGRVLLPDGEITGKALVFDSRVLGLSDPEDVGDADIVDAGGLYVSPGFVDVHIHGYGGADASDGDAEGLRRMAAGLLANGVTSFLPTTMTVPWDELETAFQSIRALTAESRSAAFPGAEILGCHAEGPFINPAKKGAQAESAVLPPDADRLLPYADTVKIVTFSPEMPGADAFLRVMHANGVALSVGHTAADYEQAITAFRAGATRVTHLFNAMPPLHHRAPGVVGAALGDPHVYTEVIADGFHVHPGLFPLLRRAKRDHLVLITDASRAAGMPDGEYTLGGQAFTLRGIECRLADGTIAGSALKMNDAVLNFCRFAGVPLHEAVRAASLNAAASAGLEKRKGSLEAGKDADIVLLDGDCRVRAAYVRGVKKYESN